MLAVEKLLNLFIDETVMDVNQCKVSPHHPLVA